MGEEFFDEIVENFFEEIGSNFRSTFCRGQIFWTHAFFSEENIAFWRPKNYDETKTSATEFIITRSTEDAFKRRIPLYSPKLEIDEEFIVVTAKKRPVILISPVPARIEAPKIRRGGKINLNLCLVAPLYSVEDIEGRAKYGNEFVDRVRMEAIDVRITEEPLNVFKGQMEYFMTGRYGDDYQVYRELLMEGN